MISEAPHHLRQCSEITFARSLISLCNGCDSVCTVWSDVCHTSIKARPASWSRGFLGSHRPPPTDCLSAWQWGWVVPLPISNASPILCLRIPAYPRNATQLMQAHPSLPSFVGTILRHILHSCLESPVALNFSHPQGHPVQCLPFLVIHRVTQFNISPFLVCLSLPIPYSTCTQLLVAGSAFRGTQIKTPTKTLL